MKSFTIIDKNNNEIFEFEAENLQGAKLYMKNYLKKYQFVYHEGDWREIRDNDTRKTYFFDPPELVKV